MNSSMWMITYCSPGDEPSTRSLDALLYSNSNFKADRFDDFHPLYDEFNSIKKGAFSIENRYILAGNLFMAADLCVKLKKGKPCAYSDVTGAYHQAMLMPEDFSPKTLFNHPVRLQTASSAIAYLLENKNTNKLFGNDDEKGGTSDFSISYMPKNKCFQVVLPKTHLHNVTMANITPHVTAPGKDTANYIWFRVADSQAAIAAVLSEAVQAGIPIYTGSGGVKWLRDYDEKQRQLQNQSSQTLTA